MASPGTIYDSGVGADGGARSDDYYDKISFGRTSIGSDYSARVVGGGASAAPDDDREKMRRNYEFRIATMQSRIATLEREVKDGDARAHQLEQSDQRVKQLEDEVDKLRRVSRHHDLGPDPVLSFT